MDSYSYAITVQKVEIEGDVFFEASVRELPDIREYAESYGEAYELAIDSIETAAELYAEEGRAFPQARVQQDDYSGRVTLRMPKSLHRSIDTYAEYEGVSINQYILSILSEGVGRRIGGYNPSYQIRTIRTGLGTTVPRDNGSSDADAYDSDVIPFARPAKAANGQ